MTNRSLLLHRVAIGLLIGALLLLAGRHYSAVHELAPVRVIIQQSEARNAQNARLKAEIASLKAAIADRERMRLSRELSIQRGFIIPGGAAKEILKDPTLTPERRWHYEAIARQLEQSEQSEKR